jgi:hypothetical protein
MEKKMVKNRLNSTRKGQCHPWVPTKKGKTASLHVSQVLVQKVAPAAASLGPVHTSQAGSTTTVCLSHRQSDLSDLTQSHLSEAVPNPPPGPIRWMNFRDFCHATMFGVTSSSLQINPDQDYNIEMKSIIPKDDGSKYKNAVWSAKLTCLDTGLCFDFSQRGSDETNDSWECHRLQIGAYGFVGDTFFYRSKQLATHAAQFSMFVKAPLKHHKQNRLQYLRLKEKNFHVRSNVYHGYYCGKGDKPLFCTRLLREFDTLTIYSSCKNTADVDLYIGLGEE